MGDLGFSKRPGTDTGQSYKRPERWHRPNNAIDRHLRRRISNRPEWYFGIIRNNGIFADHLAVSPRDMWEKESTWLDRDTRLDLATFSLGS